MLSFATKLYASELEAIFLVCFETERLLKEAQKNFLKRSLRVTFLIICLFVNRFFEVSRA